MRETFLLFHPLVGAHLELVFNTDKLLERGEVRATSGATKVGHYFWYFSFLFLLSSAAITPIGVSGNSN